MKKEGRGKDLSNLRPFASSTLHGCTAGNEPPTPFDRSLPRALRETAFPLYASIAPLPSPNSLSEKAYAMYVAGSIPSPLPLRLAS